MENRIIDEQFEVDENNVLVKYRKKKGITDVIIPDCVVEIGESAFAWCSLTSITIPENVKKIGDGAFSMCTNLINITLPEGVTEIEEGAFSDCVSLTNVTIPSCLTKIEKYTFMRCTNLTSVTIPTSVIEIEYCAFDRCINLTNITIPASVTKIRKAAFYECTNLTSITIPDSVTEIEGFAFDSKYIKEINLYSYKTFSLLDDMLIAIAIISTIKNYYSGKIKYSEEDMKLFKEYIRENKIKIFEKAKENKEIINIILKEMDNFLTLDDTLELLLKVNCDVEIKAMLTEYSNKIRDGKVNPLDGLDLGDFEETTTENEGLGKKNNI